MTEDLKVTQASEDQVAANRAAQHGYESWIRSIGIPVHEGYYLDDLRTIELGWWEERQCNAAFLQLEGQQGVAEARVTEIAPGQTLPPLKFALDDVVYVLEGRGFCTVSSDDGQSSRTFEWQKHSLFLLDLGMMSKADEQRRTGKVLLALLGLFVLISITLGLKWAAIALALVFPAAVSGRAYAKWGLLTGALITALVIGLFDNVLFVIWPQPAVWLLLQSLFG